MIHPPRRSFEAILVIVLVALSAIGQFLPVRAAGTMAISPSRTQEGNSSGVTIVLKVSGAVGGQSYTDYWAVVDPSGNNYAMTTTVVAPSSGNYTLSKVYPRDFGPGAGIPYVGQYSVAIFQTAPSNALVSAGQFVIGLTDRVFYERTRVVSIKAAGYNANDLVSMHMTLGGVSAPGFPKHVLANSTGYVIATWPTTLSTLAGNYTVSLIGTSTALKNPPDSQWFIIIPASLDVTPLVVATSGDVLAISTTIFAPDGTSLNQGNVTGQFSLSGTSVGSSPRLLYNQLQNKWTGNYSVLSNNPSGLWMLQVTASDSYGNSGQGSTSIFVIAPPSPPSPPTPQNPLTSFWFLAIITVIAAGGLMGFVFLRRKRMLPPHLQVDLKAVDVEARRFMGADFFRSIQEQLVRKKDSTKGKKDA
jgi:hypothetical protein